MCPGLYLDLGRRVEWKKWPRRSRIWNFRGRRQILDKCSHECKWHISGVLRGARYTRQLGQAGLLSLAHFSTCTGQGVSWSRLRPPGWLRFQGRASGVRNPVSSLELGSGKGFQTKWCGHQTMSHRQPGKEGAAHKQAVRCQATYMEHSRTGPQPRRLERSESTQVPMGSTQRGESLTQCLHHHQEGGPDFTFHLKTCFLCTLDFVWAGVGVGI